MADRAPYSRVYHSIVDDPKFATIYDDDKRLAAWLRLLLVAEQAHPASAYIPEGTNRGALAALVEAGLIDIGTGRRFRIHGLDAERGRRSEAARVGGLASGRSRAVDHSMNGRSTETNLDETRQEETRRDEHPRPFKREFAPGRPRHNTVNSDPLMREIKETRLKLYGKGMDEVPE